MNKSRVVICMKCRKGFTVPIRRGRVSALCKKKECIESRKVASDEKRGMIERFIRWFKGEE